MEKKRRLFFGFAALLTAALFVFAGCGNAGGGGPAGTSGDPTYVVSGTIWNIDDTRAAGAYILFEEDDGSRAISRGGVYADGNGEYAIAVPAGNYTAVVTCDGHEEGDLDITVPGANVSGQELILVQTDEADYTVSGTITTDSGGGDLTKATVRLTKNNIPIGKKVTVDASGNYITTFKVPGGGVNYTVKAYLPGYTLPENPPTVTVNSNDATAPALQLPITTYTIAYNFDNGTDPGNPASYTIETATITLAAPTRDGYDFGGWYDNAGFSGSAVTTIPAGSTGPREFWAKWNVTTATVILGAGSPGTAGNGTITGLTAGEKYVVKTDSDFYGVQANGTLGGDGTLADAVTTAGALTGTAIISLTNDETYTVFLSKPLPNGETVLDMYDYYNSVVSDLRTGENFFLKTNGGTNARTVIILCGSALEASAGGPVTDSLELEGDPLDFTFSENEGTVTLGAISAGDTYFTLSLTDEERFKTVIMKKAHDL